MFFPKELCEKVLIVMVKNSTNFNKANNQFST